MEQVLKWWRGDLFTDGLSNQPRNLETGLALLAEVGMIVEDMFWMGRDSQEDFPSYLSESWMADPEVREELAEALETQARLHADILRDILPDLDADPWRADYAVDDDGDFGDFILEDSPAERLAAALESQPTNAMQDLVDEGVTGEARAMATQRNLRNVRKEQNQLNREKFGTAHPPRPPPEPVSLPDFDGPAKEPPLRPRSPPPASATARRRTKKPKPFADVALHIPRKPVGGPPSPETSGPSRPGRKRKREPEGRRARESDAASVRSTKRRKVDSRQVPASKKSSTQPPQRQTRSRTKGPKNLHPPDDADEVLGLESGAPDSVEPSYVRDSSLEPASWAVSGLSESEPDYSECPESRTLRRRSGGSAALKFGKVQRVEFTPGPSEEPEGSAPLDDRPVPPRPRPRPRPLRRTHGDAQAGPSTNF